MTLAPFSRAARFVVASVIFWKRARRRRARPTGGAVWLLRPGNHHLCSAVANFAEIYAVFIQSDPRRLISR